MRTKDEDDGVVVLRFSPGVVVDLGSSMACQSLPGDDWRPSIGPGGAA